ncbi:uncharacterized protein LOC103870835 isoform X2 [Brassica rapa]|uniref:uncharacterized protein LOC103870835 isoform X2 n=1 Tax=Brassica campestris TaxID=3711 RepID=UPI00142DD8B2|nr:uncharacterized protein LOC103870835 isoform X2 [Brassica rapa]
MMTGGNYTTIDDSQKVSGSVPSVPDPGHTTVKFAESNLQTFPPSATQGKISGGTSNPPRDADDTFSGPGRSSTDEPHSGGWLHKFTVGAYKPFFDVDTSDVVDRLKESLFPFRGTFTEKTADKPDLYGPFWICTTLIFVAASIGTFVTSVLRLCHDRSSRLICRSQILLCTVRPSSALLSLRLFPLHLHPCFVSLGRASGDLQMGYSRCGRVHVCDFCGFEPQSAYQFRWGEIDPDHRKHLSIAAGACGCAEALSLHCHRMIHIKL